MYEIRYLRECLEKYIRWSIGDRDGKIKIGMGNVLMGGYVLGVIFLN